MKANVVPGLGAVSSGRAHMTVAEAYEAYAQQLEAYVERRFGGHVVPEDVVHETFARLVRETTAGREPALVRPWLYRVAHNLAVSELRRPIRRESAEDHQGAPEPSTHSAEADFEARSLSPEIRAALGLISRAGRTCILMAADGYTGRETAAAVGRSELATRALLCRTRSQLRGAISDATRLTAA